MGNHNESPIHNFDSLSDSETVLDKPHSTEDQTLLLTNTSTDETDNEATQKFAVSTKEDLTNHKIEFENAPTEILPDNKLIEPPNENTLRPSLLRFVLICSLFLLLALDFAALAYQYFFFETSKIEWQSKFDGKTMQVSGLNDTNSPLRVGDQIISINGFPIDEQNEIAKTTIYQKPGTTFPIQVKRNENLYEFQLQTLPQSLFDRIVDYIEIFLLSASFLLVGFTVFLLKPNDTIVLMMALMFCALSIAIGKAPLREEMPAFFKGLRFFLSLFTTLSVILFFHFFLVFPKRLLLIRRFPRVLWLLNLPALLFVPGILYFDLGLREWFPDNEIVTDILIPASTLFSVFFYLLGGLLLLLINYFRSDGEARRKLNIIVAGVSFAYAPSVLIVVIEIAAAILGIKSPLEGKDWLEIVILLPQVFIPVSFAYAIAHHKVIPVSLILRRGLQYILAKNALRILLILPVAVILWNITANPNRTLNDIILQNSLSFYICITFGISLLLINHFSLREWIDKRFFREQYNQEKILHELIVTVKEADSLVKLSRLVSSKVQSALHPENLYLFFRDDAMNSDFSLGYSAGSVGESSANLKLPADSPLLRFMQHEQNAVESPAQQTDNLPNSEINWLRQMEIALLVPMHGTDGKLAGIFLLGEKMSQIPYTARDKELLETLANQIALVYENLNLKERVQREQKIKIEVFSRLDEGNINLLKECLTCGRCFDRDVINCKTDNSKLTFTLPVERTIENRYRLEKLIGRGGMGSVYEATDTRIDRTVAVKILSGAMFGNRIALQRFEREAQTAGKLQHKNIVTIFDYGTLSTEGAFLVMELLRGESLRDVLEREKVLESKTVVKWFAQILNALEAAHKAGIVHRDLKPDNIFISREEKGEERLCILDFGIARMAEANSATENNVTIPGTIMGTLGYMPPEQLRGEKVDERADLFAAGVMIYECLYGSKPFPGKTYQEIMHSMSKKPNLEKDELFTLFFKRSLAIAPENRYFSATDMRESLLHTYSKD